MARLTDSVKAARPCRLSVHGVSLYSADMNQDVDVEMTDYTGDSPVSSVISRPANPDLMNSVRLGSA